MKQMLSILLLGVLLPIASFGAQPQKVKWKKQIPQTQPDLYLFHSTMSVNFPTAESIGKGDFEFEISHRFRSPTNTGFDGFYGLDFGANMRIALGYSPARNLMVTLGRSNINNNFDLGIKYRAFQLRNAAFPIIVAVRGGLAWNTGKIPGRDRTDSKNFQYYGQLIFNTMLGGRLGIGLVPSYLYNSHIFCLKTEDSFTLGNYVQLYLGKTWSLFVETNPTVAGWRRSYNPVSFGLELETGGHFFKVLLSNSTRLNPSQFLEGADYKFSNGDLVIGFNITRLLSFGKKL